MLLADASERSDRSSSRRLQTDDGDAPQCEWREGRDQPVEFGACVVDQTRGEKRPPAAQRPTAIRGLWDVHAVSAFDQHTQRGVEIFALVGTVEGVDKQHDFTAIGCADRVDVGSEYVAPPPRQCALRADAGEFFH
jgi:hypothetical protein